MPVTQELVIRNVSARAGWRGALQAVRSFWRGPLSLKSPEIARLFGGGPVAAGVAVNAETALGVSAFYAAITTIAADISSLPLVLLRRLPNGGRERYTSHSLYRLLHDQPNSEMTSVTFREALLLNTLTFGQGYAEIERDGAGRPVALWPLVSHRVSANRDRSGTLYYQVLNESGSTVDIPARDMLALRGPSFNGTTGLDTVDVAREALGLAIAADRFTATFFANGGHVGGVISAARPMNPQSVKNVRESLAVRHEGVAKAHRWLFLEEGLNYTPLGAVPRDSQLYELRVHQLREIARFFKIPVSRLGDLERSTYANYEQETLAYYNSCLRPWLRRIEEEFDSKLISSLERSQQHVEHVTEGLLRADTEKRAGFYSAALSHGWMTVNEVRQRENLPPIEGGDLARVPMNTEPLQNSDTDDDDAELVRAYPGAKDDVERRRCAAFDRQIDKHMSDLRVLGKVALPDGGGICADHYLFAHASMGLAAARSDLWVFALSKDAPNAQSHIDQAVKDIRQLAGLAGLSVPRYGLEARQRLLEQSREDPSRHAAAKERAKWLSSLPRHMRLKVYRQEAAERDLERSRQRMRPH